MHLRLEVAAGWRRYDFSDILTSTRIVAKVFLPNAGQKIGPNPSNICISKIDVLSYCIALKA
jgi:hypothetical protein